MCLAQRGNYKRAVIPRNESLISRTTRSSLNWIESRSSAQTVKRWGRKASFQSNGFRTKSGAQGKVRSESKARNSKTSDKRQSLCLRNEIIFTRCDCERKVLAEIEAWKSVLSIYETKTLFILGLYFELMVIVFKKLVDSRRKSNQLLILSRM